MQMDTNKQGVASLLESALLIFHLKKKILPFSFYSKGVRA